MTIMSGSYTIKDTLKDTSGTTYEGPFLVPPDYDEANGPPSGGLMMLVPEIAGPQIDKNDCGIQASGDNVDFSLSWKSEQDNQQAKYYAQVKVEPDHLISEDGRATLKKSLDAFRQALGTLEDNGCLISGGAAVITNRIAGGLPLRYDDILPYTFGLLREARSVELSPGMRLRVASGGYQYTAPPNYPGSSHNGFVASGTLIFQLRRRQDGKLGFDAFTDGIRGFDVAALELPRAEGLLDLAANGNARHHWRLIYPPTVAGIDEVDQQPALGRNVAILGADSLADLADAVSKYVDDGTCSDKATCLFFTGRAAVVPEIAIRLIGSQGGHMQEWITLGTTLADLIDRWFTLSPGEIYRSSLGLVNGGVWRWMFPVLSDNPNARYSTSQINFAQDTKVSSTTGLTQWDLPLVKGDTIQISEHG